MFSFRNSDSPKKSSPSSTYNKQLKQLHSDSYKYITDAILVDENTKLIGEKDRAIELYKKGLKILDEALALKFQDEELTDKAKTLIESMTKNKKLVNDRLDTLNKEKALQKSSQKVSSFKTTNLRTNNSAINRNRPLSSQIRTTTNRTGPVISNSITAKKSDQNSLHKNLSNLKGIDKRILDLILDNIYQPDTKVTFDDISGLHMAKQALKEIVVWPMLNPQLFTGLRTPARGVLLFGPPGTGKTMLAKSLANESKANFLSITSSGLTSKWLGESEKLVKALFSVARELKPCILFIDEVDSMLCERKENESEATRRIKTEFFIELDGLKSDNNDNVFVIAATNTPYSLDEAALRRFPKRIFVDLPDQQGRVELLRKLLSEQNNPLTENEINELATLTNGYSASDITALAQDAALGPIRELKSDQIKNLNPKNVRKIKKDDFLNSLKKTRKSCLDSSIDKLKAWNKEHGDVSL